MNAAYLNSSVGFISLTLLFTFSPVNSQTLRETVERRATVTGASHVNLRSGPGVSHPSVTILNSGEEVKVEKLEGSWYLVSLPDGSKGYVYAELIRFLPDPEKPVEPTPPLSPPTPAIEVSLEGSTPQIEPEPVEEIPVVEPSPAEVTSVQEETIEEAAPAPINIKAEISPEEPPTSANDAAAVPTKVLTLVPRRVEAGVPNPRKPWPFWTVLSWVLTPACIFILGWILGGNYYLRRDRIERTKLRF